MTGTGLYLDEAAVEGEVVPYGVLPGPLVGPVEGEAPHDKLVDPRQSDSLVRALLDCHGNEGYVAGTQTHSTLNRF